jgi:hypothetical protein
MKKIRLWIGNLCFIFLLLITTKVFAEKLFFSTHIEGIKPYKPSNEFKQKISKLSGRPIGTEAGEFDGIFDKDFYELENGNISYGPNIEYMHYRLIFDSKENLLETQELFHSDVTRDQEYYKIRPKIDQAVKKKNKYFIPDSIYYYTKITTNDDFWYEIKAHKLNKKKNEVILIFDKKFKLKGERKIKNQVIKPN